MRELVIDWNGLHSAFQTNMPEVRCFLSLESGKVHKLPPGDPMLGVVAADPHRFVAIETVPSRIQYQWVEDFVRGVEDPVDRSRMEAAINGKGAFRRFKDILLTMPEERRRWFEFRDQMMRTRIMDWVLEQGIKACNTPPWLTESAPEADTSAALHVNAPEDVQALRALLVDWAVQRGMTDVSPVLLDQLATEICHRFRIKALTGAL